MSQRKDKASPAKQIKEWAELLAPLLAGSGAIANLTYQAVPLAPSLRSLGTFIAIPFCIVAYVCTRAWVRHRPRAWSKYASYAWIWLAGFVFLGIAPYRLLLRFLTKYPPTSWTGDIVADTIQTAFYGSLFAILTVAFTIGFACFRRLG